MKFLIIFIIKIYQKLVSPALKFIFGPYHGCRFTPTCSEFFLRAVIIHGSFKGSLLGIGRIIRCNPWGSSTGFDPVPKDINKKRLK